MNNSGCVEGRLQKIHQRRGAKNRAAEMQRSQRNKEGYSQKLDDALSHTDVKKFRIMGFFFSLSADSASLLAQGTRASALMNFNNDQVRNIYG